MIKNTLNVLTDAFGIEVVRGTVTTEEAAVATGVLVRVLTPELVDLVSRAAIRDRLGVDPDFEAGAEPTLSAGK